MAALPEEAMRAVARIEAMLAEAERLVATRSVGDDDVFSLRETQRRYLPDTLDAYLKLPPSGRDAVADALLVDQLGLLERATAQRLAALSERGRSDLAANGAFLAERFSDAPAADDLPVRVAIDDGAVAAPPRTLVARFFADLQAPARSDGGAMLQLAGQRFAAVFPTLTSVRRGLFGGPVKGVALDIPRGADTLRYSLDAERGGVAASCTKIVRGVALRTERVDLGEWLHGLFEDVGAYVERDRAARDTLAAFLSG